MEPLRLSHGRYELSALPHLGGAVTRLAYEGAALLRPSPEDASDVLQTAMFPLAPYANRIAHGRFTFAGRGVVLDRNFGEHPHVLHGHAWQHAWQAAKTSAASAEMTFEYAPGDWPWAYRAAQRIELDDSGALFALTLQNQSDEPMPASIGFHPYFPRPARTTLQADVAAMWDIDATILPTRLAAPALPLREGAALDEAPFIDHCFTGWTRRALIGIGPRKVEMTASDTFAFLHLYLPLQERFFCAEPVSAMPDAVNRVGLADTGLRVLAPGATLSGWMRLAAS